MSVFVDANVFLRLLTEDDERQAEQASQLFIAAREGKVQLITGPPVLFELAWSLRTAFDLSRAQILDALARIAAMPGLKLLDAELVQQALALALEHGMEFADAYIAATAQAQRSSVATFNTKDFKRSGLKLRSWTEA
jgi:predicted nucleic acid-binding protein